MKKKTRSQLVKEADKYFSLYIRYRDGEETPDGWYANCITCDARKPIKEMQAGHFMSRRYYATRWEDLNVATQCSSCNVFKQGEQFKFGKAIDNLYGDGTADRLEKECKVIRKITTSELEQIIEDAKQYISEVA